MPEGRFISRKISVSRQLKQVSLEADFLFGRMIPHLDRDGRMDGDPEIVKAVAVPLRSELAVEIIRTCLGELDTVGLIEWYEVDGLTVCEFPGFERHQKGMKHDREAVSRYPSRHAQGSKSVRRSITSKVNSGSTPDLLRQGSAPTPATSKTDSADVKNGLPLSEVKLSKEKLSKDSADAAPAPAASEVVGEFASWPKSWAHDTSQRFLAHGVVIPAGTCGTHAKPIRDQLPFDEWLRTVDRMAKSPDIGYGLPALLRRLAEFRDEPPVRYISGLDEAAVMAACGIKA